MIRVSRYTDRPEPEFETPPTLEVPLAVWQKLMAFIQVCPTEINGFGIIERIGNKFTLTDVLLVEQTASRAAVEISAAALHRYLFEFTKQGGNAANLRFQWHSHLDMTAAFSRTDYENIESFGSGDWMISFVGNTRGEYELRLDLFRPFRVWTPMKLMVVLPLDPQVVADCSEEVIAKVRLMKPEQHFITKQLTRSIPMGGQSVRGALQ